MAHLGKYLLSSQRVTHIVAMDEWTLRQQPEADNLGNRAHIQANRAQAQRDAGTFAMFQDFFPAANEP